MGRPSAVTKSRLLATATSITATTTDANVYDIRGMSDVRFMWSCTAAAGGSAGTNYFKGKVLGAEKSDGTFVEISGCTTGEFIAAATEQTPSAANAPGVTLPRFIKIQWVETGTITDFDATVRMSFTRVRGDEAPGALPSSST